MGVDEDYEIAAALLIEAADHGYSEAKVELGLMYAKGLFFDKDPKQAAKCFGEAVEDGGC